MTLTTIPYPIIVIAVVIWVACALALIGILASEFGKLIKKHENEPVENFTPKEDFVC